VLHRDYEGVRTRKIPDLVPRTRDSRRTQTVFIPKTCPFLALLFEDVSASH